MTGLLYRELKLNWVKMIGFAFGMMIYPVLFVVLFATNSGEMDSLTGRLSIVMFGMAAFIAFLVGGVFQDAMFKDDERKKWAYYITSTPTGIKGYMGAKYIIALFWSMLTVTLLVLCNSIAADTNHEIADASVVYVGFLYIQLFMRSVEFPLMARFGGKTGKTAKIVIVVVLAMAAFVYFLFGDTSAFADMDSFWEKVISAVEDPASMKKFSLAASIIMAAVMPLYYLSYRLSVKWYLKGAENYAK